MTKTYCDIWVKLIFLLISVLIAIVTQAFYMIFIIKKILKMKILNQN